jgi:2-octaprenyl-6-methoxyphenol hydroxylase
MSKPETLYDIAIVGAGPIGLTLAYGFGQAGLRVALLDRVPREVMLKPGHDGRTTALSYSTKQLLNGLGLWSALAADAEPILDIKVCESRVPVVLDFPHDLIGDEPMGHIVDNRQFRESIALMIDSLPKGRVDWLCATVEKLETDSAAATLYLKDAEPLRARLLVAADGKFSPLRAQLGIETRSFKYGQTAIVTMIKHEKPHHGVALERFYPAGPFAALPMTDNRCSIVWSEPDAAARHYLKVDDATFHAALAERIGGYLGEFEVIGGRWNYPLMLQQASAYTAPRTALAGDTAHAIHPIAGQGVNLGMRDVALLLELVVDAARAGQDIGSEVILDVYGRRRFMDAHAMMASTDLLNRLFSNQSKTLKLVRNVGLALFEKIPPLKRGAMRYAMGIAGENAPRLLKGGKL